MGNYVFKVCWLTVATNGTNIKACFISNQKLLILSTYSVIATILLINSALYIIPVILIIMGNCFWFYFCAAWASVRWSIINTSPPPSSHAPRWLSFWAASRSWPKAATGGARGKLHKTIRSSRLWDFNSFDFSRARARRLSRDQLSAGNHSRQWIMQWDLYRIRRVIILDQLGLKIDAKIS